ncbi:MULTISPECIES: gamma-glutamyl-gamma-aminobutyrate hydrolase family protein [Thermococcus]|jgi:putative glutamine amidotransferase|uniref:Putative glutamine amidotransferase n=1 Tax=Thermococcus sibiricus TaxID=172049 RepID=A0A101EKX8_9EURY|nr:MULTISPECIES: gamma-glutamyl-gamma-aminobutyrate hydrolase family protein [Thermococcus]KUK16815.1 MAG: Putative glutamine amidotransferase [Thermococcus sibiricus]MDK2983432.1 putative glutamine amidotransferase [Thermococcaceae archaeon]
MKPIIGIVASFDWEAGTFTINDTYVRRIKKAGGIPVAIPPLLEITDVIEAIDGLIIPEGPDIHPRYYGDTLSDKIEWLDIQRDEFELTLIKAALERDLPMLGIGRGAQAINVALGGSLYQDVSEIPRAMRHNWLKNGKFLVSPAVKVHDVRIKTDSLLFEVLKENLSVESTSEVFIEVNSFHHQAIKKLGDNIKPVAYAEDGIIEAIEVEGKFAIGVQWWAEYLDEMEPLFKALVEKALEYKKKKLGLLDPEKNSMDLSVQEL